MDERYDEAALERAAADLGKRVAELAAEIAKVDPRTLDPKERSHWLTLAGKAFGLIDRMQRAAERRSKTVRPSTPEAPVEPTPKPLANPKPAAKSHPTVQPPTKAQRRPAFDASERSERTPLLPARLESLVTEFSLDDVLAAAHMR